MIVSVSTISFNFFEGQATGLTLYGNYELTDLLITSLFLVGSLSVFSHQLYNKVKTESFNLEEANTRFHEIFDNSNDSILVLKKDGGILDANLAAIRKMGYSKDELLGMSIIDLYNYEKDESAKNEAGVFQFHEDGSLFETKGTHKDSSIIPVEVSNRSFVYNSNPCTISVVRDITERKQVQKAISAKAEAEELNRIKSNFLANMSHELRTPLNSIIGFSQVLIDENFGALNEKQSQYSANIMRSGEHLLEVINDILDISKVEAGKMSFVPEKISLKSTIVISKMLVQPLADKKSIIIKTDIEPGNDELLADKTKLKEILYNLLSNSIKFTPEKGSVDVVVKQDDEMMYFSVSDTGIGIAKADQESIFDPFKQVQSFATRDVGGTGLGLALVKEYVEMHGGTIELESDVGKGSTFSFTIPVNGTVQ